MKPTEHKHARATTCATPTIGHSRHWLRTLFLTTALAASAVPVLADSIGVFRSGGWIIDDRNDGWNGTNGSGRPPEGVRLSFGLKGDRAMLGDVDGDGRDEVVVYRPGSGNWYFDRENNGFQRNPASTRILEAGERYPIQFGGFPGDIGLMGNLLGARDSRDEVVIYRASTGHWIIDAENDGYQSERVAFQFGGFPGDKPLLADLNGDGLHEPVIFRVDANGNGTWYIDWERNGFSGEGVSLTRGGRGDVPVVGDVTGDGRDELGIYRRGLWVFYDLNGRIVFSVQNFGLPTDQPVVGNIDGGSNLVSAAGGRGLSCLHCGHPQALTSAQSIAQAIGAAKLERPVISFLIDDHFGFDPRRFRTLIDGIGGRYPHVALYLLNGPGQRRWQSNRGNQLSKGFGTNVSPQAFNRLIERQNRVTINMINQHFQRAQQICDLVFRKGGRCFVAPALEDNLSNAAVQVLARAFESWRAGQPITFVRNRNGANRHSLVPSVWLSEVHTRNSSEAADGRYAMVSTDDGEAFPGYCRLKDVADASTRRGKIFVAWNKDTQGIPIAGQLPNPDRRRYAALTTTQQRNATTLLRAQCR